MIHCEFCDYLYADEFNFGHCPMGCHDLMPSEADEE